MTLQFPNVSVAQTAANVIANTAGAEIPLHLRTAADVELQIIVRDSTIQNSPGRIKFFTDGSIEISINFAGLGFSGTNNGGFQVVSFSYIFT